MPRFLLLLLVLADVNFTCTPSSACADDEDDCADAEQETGETGGNETGETGEPVADLPPG